VLKPVDTGASIVVCSTCRLSDGEREDADGRRGGALLYSALEAAIASHPCSGRLALQRMPCLFACTRHCTVQLRAPGKISYVLGGLRATAADAAALLDFAYRYVRSDIGVVPYNEWPQGIKGHFVTRSPPDGFVVV
jgi:predicted metal-binding protein